jgi:hypothetical protein
MLGEEEAMVKSWDVSYKGHSIRVENSSFGGERLLVDGELQDEHKGFDFRSRLQGCIKTGDGAGDRIKVSLGGLLSIQCRIFVNDTLVTGS